MSHLNRTASLFAVVLTAVVMVLAVLALPKTVFAAHIIMPATCDNAGFNDAVVTAVNSATLTTVSLDGCADGTVIPITDTIALNGTGLTIKGNLNVTLQSDGSGRFTTIGATEALTVDGVIMTNFDSGTSSGGVFRVNDGSLVISNSMFMSNAGASGAVVHVENGTATVGKSSFFSNTATNTATSDGGAVNFANGSNGIITNSTFYRNSAADDGGAISFKSTGTLAINNVTVYSNTAGAAGGNEGGGIYENNGTVNVDNSIVAGNTAGAEANCSAGVVGTANSYSENAGCANFTVDANATNFEMMLDDGSTGPSAPYTQTTTLVPMAPNPAIDGGNAGTCEMNDQRGAPRNNVCDAGAHETGITPLAVTFSGTDAAAANSGIYTVIVAFGLLLITTAAIITRQRALTPQRLKN